jgi:hypothetical protein
VRSRHFAAQLHTQAEPRQSAVVEWHFRRHKRR